MRHEQHRGGWRAATRRAACLGPLVLAWWGLLALVPAGVRLQAAEVNAPIIVCDLTPLFSLDLADDAQRRRFWDETHLAVSLQGLVNREKPRLFLRYLAGPDDFWWREMTRPGGWLEGREIVQVTGIAELLERFRADYRGAVVWDERVPATSNVASTIAGCEGLLCVRYDEREGSLHQRCVGDGRPLEAVIRLLAADGSPLFTGRGRIPGTDLESSGSAKNDAYRWLIRHYVESGKANPQRMGYYLDADWFRSWKAAAPENHTLVNHDFVIAHRGVLFDLNAWDDEACVDDPGQAPGTDLATLKQLLHAACDRLRGAGMIHVAGFVPWAYKYTTHGRAGGKHAEVPTEWRFAEVLSCFNAYLDADALGLGAMANASFYQHYPLVARYPQNPRPAGADLVARGLLDAAGRVVPRAYVAHYVGDYDAAAWLYRELPRMWRDPARGRTPLSWAFNPNLSERFPVGMAWARAHRSTNDWFVAGDSGAGYLNPGYVTPPRPHSGLPSGLETWERHCRRFYEQWDLTITGFIIDGYARGLSPEGLDAYARFSPDGIVAQKIPPQGIHRGMPFLRMATDLSGSPAEAASRIAELGRGTPPRFVVCRSILQAPAWYAAVSVELEKLAGDSVRVVDLYTLMALVRIHESRPEAQSAASAPADPDTGESDNPHAGIELVRDPGFARGFTVLAPAAPAREVGRWKSNRDEEPPIWQIAQWNSRHAFSGSPADAAFPGSWSNTARWIAVGAAEPGGMVLTLGVDSRAEYRDGLRQSASEPWVHLLVQQEIVGAPSMAEAKALRLRFKTRLVEAETFRPEGYSPGLHAAQYQLVLTLNNTRSSSAGHGDFLWFVVPLYDDRHAVPPDYVAQDFAVSAGKLIYNPGLAAFSSQRVQRGQWLEVDSDVRPLLEKALETAWAKGYLRGSTDRADYRVASVNLGWEVPGLNRVAMDLRDLSLRALP